MFGEKMDIAAIEAILGFTTWVDEEDSLDVTYLIDKSIREGGLSLKEEMELRALQALYESGR
jgi:hypothetical protein